MEMAVETENKKRMDLAGAVTFILVVFILAASFGFSEHQKTVRMRYKIDKCVDLVTSKLTSFHTCLEFEND